MLQLQYYAATIDSMGKVLAENAQDAESEGDSKLAAATMHVAGYVSGTIGPEWPKLEQHLYPEGVRDTDELEEEALRSV